jgi:hypothetical protein
MLTAPVPTWIDAGSLSGKVAHALATAGVLAVPLRSLAEVGEVGADVCIVDGEIFLGAAGGHTPQRCALAAPRTEFLVLYPGPGARDSAAPPMFRFCDRVSDLPAELFRLRLRRWKEGLVGRIRTASHLPFALREALIAVVRQEFPEDLDAAEFRRTVGWAAQRVGVSREHLSRLAYSASVDFRSFADSFASVLAVAGHKLNGAPWSDLAIRMGFRWQSGLTMLVRRGLGQTPTAALDLPLDELLERWERLELGGILGESGQVRPHDVFPTHSHHAM